MPDVAARVAQNAPAMLFYLDTDLRVRFANRHCYDLLGRAPREILGRLLAELLDERTLKYAIAHVAEVDRGNGAPRDYVLRDHEGARRFVQIHAVADRDAEGRSVGYIACSADNAERRAAEERLRHALAGTGAGMWEWNLKANEIYYSPEFSALLGYEQSRFAADFNFLAMVHPEDHEATFDALAAAVQDGRLFDREFRMLCADGNYRWLRGVGRVVRDPDSGAVLRFIGTARDIAARKHAEQELREARELVTATVEGCLAVTDELDERRRLDRVKRELYTAVNHELRTPLASIIAALDLLREGADSREGSRDAFLELALQNAEQLARVVEQWLDLERIDLGMAGIRRVALSLVELVETQIKQKAALAAERGVHLETAGAGAAHVSGDPERLAQAIGHIIANAIERSPWGATVRVHVGVRGQRAVLLVEDEGVDVMPNVDLGLSACRAIIERQGGGLQVANRTSRGVAFHLEMPCS